MASSGIRAVSTDWRSNFLARLNPQNRKRILAAAKQHRFAAHSVITNQGHPADQLFLLIKGRARYFFDEHGGQRVILLWVAPGELIGGRSLLAKPVSYLVGSETVRDSTVFVWDRDAIRDLASQYPVLLENALSTASDYLAWYVAAHVALACHSAEQRLAGVLNSLAGTIGRKVPGGIELDLTNEELANTANITPFTASRLLSAWRRQHFLKKSRGKLLLRHPVRSFQHEL
jgi:CRP/FNR family transcriptional regulator, nitrogen oxide reductase regulator